MDSLSAIVISRAVYESQGKILTGSLHQNTSFITSNKSQAQQKLVYNLIQGATK